MKSSFARALLGVLCVPLAVTPFGRAGAQTPFTSTSPPNSNPFGSQGGGSNFGSMRPARPAPAPQYGQPAYAAAAPAPAYSSGPIDPDHRLEPGDHLSFQVKEDRDDKVVPLVVSDSGQVYVPLLGLVKAVGKNTTELTAEIKGSLEREYYYHASVIMGLDAVAARSSLGKIYVQGAVKNPGPQDLPPGATLTAAQAIAAASGGMDFADLSHVRVIRKGGPDGGIRVDVKLVDNGRTDKDVALQPGDIVKVPQKMFNF